MRIRKRCHMSSSLSLPPPYLSSSNTLSRHQPKDGNKIAVTEAQREGRELHPSEALLQRIRDLSDRFHQRFKSPISDLLHPVMEKIGDGNGEAETKKRVCMQHDLNHLDDFQGEKGEGKDEKKLISVENGISTKMRNENSSSDSAHQVGRWLEEEKAFPFKKRKMSIPWERGGGEIEVLVEKENMMKIKLKKTNITRNSDGDEDKEEDDDGDGYGDEELCVNGKGERGDGVASMDDMKVFKRPHEEGIPAGMNRELVKASNRRASILIEGMQMTSNLSKREENAAQMKCPISKKRGRRPRAVFMQNFKIINDPNDKEEDAEVEEVQVVVRRNLITNKRRRSAIKISDEEAEEEYGLTRRRGRRPVSVIEKSYEGEEEEEEEEKIGVTRSIVTADGGGVGAIMQGSRCSRYNGRGWRCRQLTLVGYSLCEHHLGKGRMKSMSSVGRKNNASTIATQSPYNGREDGERTPWPLALPCRKGKEVMVEDEDEDVEEMQRMTKKKRGRGEASFSKQLPCNH